MPMTRRLFTMSHGHGFSLNVPLHGNDKVEHVGRSQLPTSLMMCVPCTGSHFGVKYRVLLCCVVS
jgi:hypothetical protein